MVKQPNMMGQMMEMPKRSRGRPVGSKTRNAGDLSSRTALESLDFDVVFQALLAYKATNGDLNVNPKFVISRFDPSYPESTWGMKLGAVVRKLRSGRRKGANALFPDHTEELRSIGFEFEPVRNRSRLFDKCVAAITAYRAKHGDLRIHKNFIITNNDPAYPEYLWGMKLGQLYHKICKSKNYLQFKEDLINLGFDVAPMRRRRKKSQLFPAVYHALQLYKEKFGHIRVPLKYHISEDDESYPEDCRGLKLGYIVNNIRHNHTFADFRTELQEIGFQFEVARKKDPIEKVLAALRAFRRVHGNVKMKPSFVVPKFGEPGFNDYPKEALGMNLGYIVHRIRYHDTYPEHRGELEALGCFDQSVFQKRKPTEPNPKMVMPNIQQIPGNLHTMAMPMAMGMPKPLQHHKKPNASVPADGYGRPDSDSEED